MHDNQVAELKSKYSFEVTRLRQQNSSECSVQEGLLVSKDLSKSSCENEQETTQDHVTQLTTIHQLENELFYAKSECQQLSTRLAIAEREQRVPNSSTDQSTSKVEVSQSSKPQMTSMSQTILEATFTPDRHTTTYKDLTPDTKKLMDLSDRSQNSSEECGSQQQTVERQVEKRFMEDIDDDHQKSKVVDVKSWTPTQLESEVYRLRSEVNLLTSMCQELEKERASLTDELEKLKQSLQDNEEDIVKNKTDDNKELETLQRRLQSLEDEVVTLISERDTFQSSLEELDVQHQQAIDQILASRDSVQQKYKELVQENENLLAKCRDIESERHTAMQFNDSLENEAKMLQEKLIAESARTTSTIANVSKLLEWFDEQSFVPDETSALTEGCKSDGENELLRKVSRMVNLYHKLLLDNQQKSTVLQDMDQRTAQLQNSLQDKEKMINDLQVNIKSLEEGKTALEFQIQQQKHGDLKREATDSMDGEVLSNLSTKELSDSEKDSILLLTTELENSRSKVQQLEVALEHYKLDQTRSSNPVENYSQTDVTNNVPVVSVGSQAEEMMDNEPKGLGSEHEFVTTLQKQISELKQTISTLETQLKEKDRHISGINDILHIYKENLDPDHDAMKKRQEEMVSNFTAQIKALELERDRMMAILNDKARENSALKLEVHRLVNVVSAERAALSKMQRDCEEMSRQSNVPANSETEDMTKEAMKNLAHLVREREIEIEALRQRNATLLTLLQEQDNGVPAATATTNDNSKDRVPERPNATAIQALLSERDQLKRSVERHQLERDQIVNALNQKHQESVSYHAEIQRLLGMLDHVNKKYSALEESQNSVVRQLEDQKKAAFETATEIVAFSNKTSELERSNETLRTQLNHLRSATRQSSQEDSQSDDAVIVSADGKEFATLHLDVADWNSKLQELERLKRAMQDKDKLLYEKDCVIHEKMRHIQNAKELLQRKEDELSAVKHHLDRSSEETENCRQEMQNSRELNTTLRSRMEDLRSEIAVLKGTNSTLSVTLQEREFELKALREKLSVLGEMVENQASSSNAGEEEKQLKRLLNESEEMRLKAQGFQAERDQALLALAHKQRETKELLEQIKAPKEEQERLLKELDRLRTHLLQVEESYTQEALKAEEREHELRSRLARAEDRIHATASSHSAASHHAYLQVESLQEQLKTVVDQRDDILVKLSMAEDQIAQKSAALHTLQMVLEQLQQERQRDVSGVHALYRDKLAQANQNSDKLLQEIGSLQNRLEEADKALEAASRLSEQLDRKEDTIRTLREEVKFQEMALQKAKQEIQHLASNNEVTVDRTVMKNLMLGFLTVTKGQQKEVLKVIATILDFNKEERERTGISEVKVGWITSWIPRKQSPSSKSRHSQQHQQPSFTEAFVQFLESESLPRPQVKLPIESLVASRVSDRNKSPSQQQQQQQQQVQKPEATSGGQSKGIGSNSPINPFTYSLPGPKSTDSLSSQRMGSSHLLLKPMMTALPTFSPMPVSEWTSTTNSILQDVLKDD